MTCSNRDQIDTLRALVCGMPQDRWRRSKWLMIRQAFGDESGSGMDKGWLIYAGFLASIDRWCSFTEEWQKALALDPPYQGEEFHMSKANFAPEDYGWSREEFEKRVCVLVDIIVKHVDAGVVIILPNKVWKAAAGSDPPLHAYHLVCGNFITMMLVAPQNFVDKSTDKLNIILDSQDQHKAALEMYLPSIRQQLKPEQHAHLETLICAQDSTLYVPLQAADVLAWYEMRKRTHPDDDIANNLTYKKLTEGIHIEHQVVGEMYLHRWVDANRAKLDQLDELAGTTPPLEG